MFLREIKANGKTYLHIIHAYRQNGKVKQKSLAALGCVDDLKSSQLQNIARGLLQYCRENRILLDVSSAEEKQRKCWGPVKVFGKLWDVFQFPKLLFSIQEETETTFDFPRAAFLMVLDRLAHPKSKLKSHEEQHGYHGFNEDEIPLHHLYRSLDIFSRYKQTLEDALFQKNVSLCNMSVDVVLYDVTTLYFESVRADDIPEGAEQDEAFKEFGFSKDGKIKEVQVTLGLLVDTHGRPIGFDVFPGNTYEGGTLKKALDKLKKRFHIQRVIVIADQGMLSRENIQTVKGLGYEYIIGGRIKNKSKRIQETILAEEGYEEMAGEDDEASIKVKKIPLKEDTLICSWSKKRAEKDQRDREHLIERAKKILEQKQGTLTSRRGAFKYIDVEAAKDAKLDEKKITDDTKWDGYYGIQTNIKDLLPESVLSYYQSLWRVEESFRLWKTHLETRPVFHWTPRRIKGHLVVCFIAFLMERTLEIELKKQGIQYSAERIRKALNELQYSEMTLENQTFYLRSPIAGLANDILRALKLKIPPQMTSAANFG